MLTLHNKLTGLGNGLIEKYNDIIPSQLLINEFTNDLTNGVYDCCQESKVLFTPTTRIPQQQNCTSDNFKAIAEAHKYRYENLQDDQQLSEYHKKEWLFYQTIAWEKEQEEMNVTKNTKWKVYSKEPRKLWKMIDYKGETQSNTSCPPKVVRNYFCNNIFNSHKLEGNPTLKEIEGEIEEYDKINEITDRDFSPEELTAAIKKYGKGVSFDGLPGSILHILPENLRGAVLQLYKMSYNTFYPTPWQSQLLSPIEKKGHSIISPKLRGTAVGPMFSRLYDIMINFRFMEWYTPNPQQAGGERKGQGCIIQIFGLFIMLDMAKRCGKTLFIGLLDFEKAFDYMNRPRLMKDMMKDGIGSTFLKNLNNMYSEIHYLPKTSKNHMDDPIISEHGVTQGRTSSGNLFSYYISDMSQPMDEKAYIDFMIANLLQLADDSIVLADNLVSLANKLIDVLRYCRDKLTIVNMEKTNYMEFSDEPTMECIEVEEQIIEPVNPEVGYVWLGFHLSYNSDIYKLVEHHIRKKKSNEAKFYAWLKLNSSTPFPMKLKVLYACFFEAIIYSSEAWGDISFFKEELLLIEKKALRAIVCVKSSTPDNIVFAELNKADIMATIHQRQYNFFKKFLQLSPHESTTRSIWELYREWNVESPTSYFTYYSSLSPTSLIDNINEKKNIIIESNTSMNERYRSIIGFDFCNALYSSLINDEQRATITRWRLSCHPLFVERGRYCRPKPPRSERKCLICMVMEDEEHSLFSCLAHREIRHQHQELLREYRTVREILHPRNAGDVTRISKYLENIEANMDKLKMKR